MSELTFTPAELRDAAVARQTAKYAEREQEIEKDKLAQEEKTKATFKANYSAMLAKFEWLAQWPITISQLGVRIELPECVPIEVTLADNQHLRFDVETERHQWHFHLDEAIYVAKRDWEWRRDENERQEQQNAAWAEAEYGTPKTPPTPDERTSLANIAKLLERIALVMEEAHK